MRCSCHDGYQLLNDDKSCIGGHTLIVTAIKHISTIITDINECLNNNGLCSHNCTNIVGSYYCECPDGYLLQPNQHDCIRGELSLQQALASNLLVYLTLSLY